MREAFEAAIIENPDDLAAYSAFADWLIESGDPQGEFMRVQLALEDESLSKSERNKLKKAEAALLKKHRAEWLGPFAELEKNNPTVRDHYFETYPNYSFTFTRGHLSKIHAYRLYVKLARTLRDAPQTKLLRELEFEAEDNYEEEVEDGPDLVANPEEHPDAPGLHVLLQRTVWPGLRYFSIGEPMEPDEDGNHGSGDCHTSVSIAVDLIERMPRLEVLQLNCKRFDIEGLFRTKKLPRLSYLQIYHFGRWHRPEEYRYEYPLDLLAKNKNLPNLTHIIFHPHHIQGSDGISYLPLDQVRLLLRSNHFPKLTHLQLRLSNMGKDGCRALVESKVLRRLKWLDLRHGCVNDYGAKVLAACPDVRNLGHLDLSRNALTAKGIAALKATGVPLRAEAQQTPEELADHQYLREGDFE